ncbi:leucine-rich repeat-containing protein 46 [Rhincodon typus]|uniref:leucine-rich repeat-containing protein 46 n=1 Tax=Rhincodon typus TaxID=259920 RepID=UPI0009A40B73|nr:leucine-rich repeat-containing protein 46 [Rhincodon typus]
MSLIAKRNLQLPAEKLTPEDITNAVGKLTTVRLDRENIGALENIECLENVCSLYLQQNQIKRIENLELLGNLRFLTLASNKIQKVENLKPLQQLGFLDLSNNQIEQLDPGEFPESLIILKMTDNDCTKHEGYRERVIEALPALQQLDGDPIQRRKEPNETDEESGASGHSESEEDMEEQYDTETEREDSLPEISVSRGKVKEFFVDIHKEIVCRSQWRRKEAETDHKLRMNELEEIRKQITQRQYEPIRMKNNSSYQERDQNVGLSEAGTKEMQIKEPQLKLLTDTPGKQIHGQ